MKQTNKKQKINYKALIPALVIIIVFISLHKGILIDLLGGVIGGLTYYLINKKFKTKSRRENESS